MRPPSGIGEGRRHDDQVDRPEPAVELGKAQVVADRQGNSAKRRVDRGGRVAGLDEGGLVVAFITLAESEQVQLVVALHAFALRIVDQGAVAHLVGRRSRQRQRAGDQPDAVPARGRRQPVLHRAGAKGLAGAHPVGIGSADDRKILGQQHQLRALAHGIGDQPLGRRQVVGHPRPGDHLHRRDPGVRFTAHCQLAPCFPACPSPAPSDCPYRPRRPATACCRFSFRPPDRSRFPSLGNDN